MTKPVMTSLNEASRLQTIASIMRGDGGALFKGASIEHAVISDIIFNGSFWYSDKPPLLAIAGAGIASALQIFLSGSLVPTIDQPSALLYALIFICSGIPLLALGFFAFNEAYKRSDHAWWSLFAVACLVAGTMLLPFATVFSNHILLAFLVYTGFMSLMHVSEAHADRTASRLSFGAGIVFAVCWGIDPVIASPLCIASIVFLFLCKRPRVIFPFLIGNGIAFSIVSLINYSQTGTIFPWSVLQFLFRSVPENAAKNNIYAIDFSPAAIIEKLRYALFSFDRGIFTTTPIVFVSIIYFIAAMKKKRPLALLARTFGIVSLIIFMLVITLTTDFSGSSVAVRWFAPLLPVPFWFMAISAPPRMRWAQACIALAAIVSIVWAVHASIDPWRLGVNVTFLRFML